MRILLAGGFFVTMLGGDLQAAASNSLAGKPGSALSLANQALREKQFLKAEQLARQALNSDEAPIARWKAWAIIGMSRQVRLRFPSALEAYENSLAALPEAEKGFRLVLQQQVRYCRCELAGQETPLSSDALKPQHRQNLGGVENYWTRYQQGHYSVKSRNRELSVLLGKQVSKHVRRLRRELSIPQAELPADLRICVWPDETSYRQAVPHAPDHGQGCTTYAGPDGQTAVRIDLVQRNASGTFNTDLLDQALPHELAHVLVRSYLAGQAHLLPLALHEGLAMLCEPSEDPSRFFLAATALSDERLALSLEELLAIEHYDEAIRPDVFYAESYALAEFLRSKLPGEQFTEFIDGIRQGLYARQSLQHSLGGQYDPLFFHKLQQQWRQRVFLQADILQSLQQADAQQPPRDQPQANARS